MRAQCRGIREEENDDLMIRAAASPSGPSGATRIRPPNAVSMVIDR
jgi:hypothetical protein